jgi:glycerophosphoryl diester phosphodiesterase
MLSHLQKLVDFGYAAIPRSTPKRSKLERCKIIAHRGIHDNSNVIENTLAAFDLAVDHGVYGIEFDIRWTRDLCPIVFHDADLNRLFQSPQFINTLTLQELQSNFPAIPTLEQVLARYGNKLHLMAEFKWEHYPQPAYQNQVLQQLFTRLAPIQNYHLMTLQPSLLSYINFAPKQAWLLIAELNMQKLFRLMQALQLGGITGHYVLASNTILNYCLQHNLLFGTGFIDSKNCLYRELNRGVEWIFSNQADLMQLRCSLRD